ncbi:hypothetical protein Q1695_004601 [Nippostrongylus brasiliensis]|nr:hypothetical protein Q1695_004601 [Nippostrongylus brasiliensis]
MKKLLVLAALATICYAQDNGVKCDYPPTGDETLQNAVPITDFHTSGSDFVRPNWCITHCKDRKSIKAALNFQPSNSNPAVAKMRSYHIPGEKRVQETFSKNGDLITQRSDEDPNQYCADPAVAAIADQVFANYTDVENLAEGLNYYVNKPGWAYLVFQLAPPPGFVTTSNMHIDTNFCMKNYILSVKGVQTEFFMLSGLVQS